MREGVIVFGASGFLARFLTQRFSKGQLILVTREAIVYDSNRLDFNDKNLELVASKFHSIICYYCAVVYVNKDPKRMFETNALIPYNLIKESSRYKIKLFLYLDTFFSLYGLENNEHKAYVESKLSCNSLIDSLNLSNGDCRVITAYIHHMYGPNQNRGIFYKVFTALKNEESIGISSCFEKRDFIYVEDVVEALLFIAKSQNRFKRRDHIEIGSGHVCSVRKALLLMHEIIGSGEICFSKSRMPGQIDSARVMDGKLKRLGWEPRFDLNKGFLKMLNQ